VVPVHDYPAVIIEVHHAGAMHPERASPQFEHEDPLQRRASPRVDTADDLETRLADLFEHVAEHLCDRGRTGHFVERIAETRLRRIDIAERAERLRRERLVEMHQTVEVCAHSPVTLRIRGKYQRRGSSESSFSTRVKRFGKWTSKS